MSKTSMKRKIDKKISEIVRSRGECVWCGNRRYELLQCCHIYTRVNMATRWDLLNLLCMCAGCHFKGHHNPTEFADFVRAYLGDQKYEELRQRANSIKKWTLQDMKEFYKSLK